MTIISIILIALGLAMDAFAVSITSGIVIKNLKVKNALKIATFFGVFQALMPLLGWIAGVNFKDYITAVDHWIAFILLGVIGGKMIIEALKDNCEVATFDPLNNKVLLMLAIATSIDALAVGVSFAFLEVPLIISVCIIGILTFIICFIGVLIGKKCGCLFKKRAELAGGVILVFMGAKIIFEHLNLASVFNIFK